MMHAIAIIELGLIGGSLGFAWKKRRKNLTIMGRGKPSVSDFADKRGILSDSASGARETVAGSAAKPVAADAFLFENAEFALCPPDQHTNLQRCMVYVDRHQCHPCIHYPIHRRTYLSG